jgi:predicted Fe-Mo cluster-binding NifX family protein
MKICVSAANQSLDAQIDPRFGRCQYFVIVDSDTKEFETISNDATSAMHGAGIQAAQTVVKKGAEVVVTGNVGPNAFQVLSAAGIRIVTGVSGTVKEAVEQYTRGELKEISGPTVGGHHGMRRGRRGRW